MSNLKTDCGSVYLDYQATTPCDPRVVEAMMPYLTQSFGNAHSRTHCYGWIAEQGVKESREKIAETLGVDHREIIFTSGATEANNLAIKGVAAYLRDQKSDKNHFITPLTEHKCVLESFRFLETQGFQVTYLPVKEDGLVCLTMLEKAITPQTAMISVMGVHNEIGVIQPLADIGRLCTQYGILFHSDCAQALGRIPLPLKALGIDLASFSGHKMYGPKGIGALYVARHPRRVRLRPLFSGGGQERGLRSGTIPTFLCVGLGKAAEIATSSMAQEKERLTELRDYFYHTILERLPRVYLNGSLEHRVPDNLNLSFAGVEGEGLLMGIANLALSSGSACTSESLEPSYVLRALGVKEDLAHTSLRISLGRYTIKEDLEEAIRDIVEAVERLRSMSPLWDMLEQGIDLNSVKWSAH